MLHHILTDEQKQRWLHVSTAHLNTAEVQSHYRCWKRLFSICPGNKMPGYEIERIEKRKIQLKKASMCRMQIQHHPCVFFKIRSGYYKFNQHTYLETQKGLREPVRGRGIRTLTWQVDSLRFCSDALAVCEFLAKKSITKTGYLPYSTHLFSIPLLWILIRSENLVLEIKLPRIVLFFLLIQITLLFSIKTETIKSRDRQR